MRSAYVLHISSVVIHLLYFLARKAQTMPAGSQQGRSASCPNAHETRDRALMGSEFIDRDPEG
jgi:hypothetical protein